MATSTNTQAASRPNFDFNAYNETMKTANTGLKMYLAEQMLREVSSTLAYFNNPLQKDASDIVEELGQLRNDNKKLAAKAQQASGEIDDSTLDQPASSSADSGKVDAT